VDLLRGARRLDALPREKAVDGLLVHAEDTTHADRVETSIVNQAADRLGMDAELSGDLADAIESVRLGVDRRHDSLQALHAAAARARGRSAQFDGGLDQSLPSNIPVGSRAAAEITANAIKHATTARW
jgi:hypothetical protein